MIHITGTNGKTSTARIAEALAGAAGSRTGLLSSPHLVRVNERIRIAGAPISDERFAVNWDDISPIIELVDAELERAGEPRLTFFEALTVLGYSCFTDAGVEVGIVEVGMGGEWDSTNVADADVAVFTPIALDHENRLGATVEEIARTKAGIIKPGCIVVTAEQRPEALAELRRAAELRGASLLVEGDDFGVISDDLAVGGRLVELRGIAGPHEAAALRLIGEHQARNAALALAAVESFYGEPLSDEQVVAGLADARSPGRLEVIGTEPTVVVDAAHNPHGAERLVAAMREAFAFDELVLVLGVLGDKQVDGIARLLAPLATRIIATASGSDRAIPAWELAERIREAIGDDEADAKGLQSIDDARDAFELARREAAALAREGVSTGVLITGSITLIGEAVAEAEDGDWRVAPTGAAPLEIGAGDPAALEAGGPGGPRASSSGGRRADDFDDPADPWQNRA